MWLDINSQYKLLRIVRNSTTSEPALDQFYADFFSCFKESDRLNKNYALDRFDIKNHVMFDALYSQKNEFIACAGIYRRSAWPEGAFRLLNRTYYNPIFRKQSEFQFFGSDYILPIQFSEMHTQPEFSFVSREGPFAGLFLKKLLARQFFQSHSFKVSDVFIQVVPGVFDRLAFQKILYCKHNTQGGFSFSAVANLNDLADKNLIQRSY